MWQACFLSIPGFTRDQQIDVVSCINGNGHAYDSGAVNDATLRVCSLNSYLLTNISGNHLKTTKICFETNIFYLKVYE